MTGTSDGTSSEADVSSFWRMKYGVDSNSGVSTLTVPAVENASNVNANVITLFIWI